MGLGIDFGITRGISFGHFSLIVKQTKKNNKDTVSLENNISNLEHNSYVSHLHGFWHWFLHYLLLQSLCGFPLDCDMNKNEQQGNKERTKEQMNIMVCIGISAGVLVFSISIDVGIGAEKVAHNKCMNKQSNEQTKEATNK